MLNVDVSLLENVMGPGAAKGIVGRAGVVVSEGFNPVVGITTA